MIVRADQGGSISFNSGVGVHLSGGKGIASEVLVKAGNALSGGIGGQLSLRGGSSILSGGTVSLSGGLSVDGSGGSFGARSGASDRSVSGAVVLMSATGDKGSGDVVVGCYDSYSFV